MPGQIDLPGFEAAPGPAPRPPARRGRPPGPNNLFFALVPAADVVPIIVGVQSQLRDHEGLSGKPIGVDRLHVTLHDLGGCEAPPAAVIEAVRQAAATVRVPPFEVVFDRVLSFANRQRQRPFVLCCSAELPDLAAFRSTLGRALAEAGVWNDEMKTPHMTLLYDDRLVGERIIAPIRWTAHEFVLVRSLRGLGRHEVVARLPLGA